MLLDCGSGRYTNFSITTLMLLILKHCEVLLDVCLKLDTFI